MDIVIASVVFPLERLDRVLGAAYRLSRPCIPGANTPDTLPRWWLFHLVRQALQCGGLLHAGCVGGRGLRLTILIGAEGCEWLSATRWMDHTQLELETLRDVALGAPFRD